MLKRLFPLYFVSRLATSFSFINHNHLHRAYSRTNQLRSSSYDEISEIPTITTTTTRYTSTTAVNLLPSLSSIKGIIFDMDGTLLKPFLDFPKLRREIYEIASSDLSTTITHGCVLEVTEKLSPEGKRRAKQIFDKFEQMGIENMEEMDGMVDLMHFLDSRDVKRAVLTRNVDRSVDAMHDYIGERFGVRKFYPVVTRDTEVLGANGRMISLPPKPEPDAILHICDVWGCTAKDVIMIGDSAADDIVCANRAGCGGSVLLETTLDNCSGAKEPEHLEQMKEPSTSVKSLAQIISIFMEQSNDC